MKQTREDPNDWYGITPYEALGNAIILRAVNDYRRARRKLRRNPDNIRAAGTIKEVTRFFRSRYFGILTELDGQKLLQQLQEEKQD